MTHTVSEEFYQAASIAMSIAYMLASARLVAPQSMLDDFNRADALWKRKMHMQDDNLPDSLREEGIQ